MEACEASIDFEGYYATTKVPWTIHMLAARHCFHLIPAQSLICVFKVSVLSSFDQPYLKALRALRP